jgi:hypothetical protein
VSDVHRLVGLLAIVAAPSLARGESVVHEVPLFTITKSENKNHVVYALRLNARCLPAGDAPIHPYWRLLEKGPFVTEPLLAREERAYGVARQSVAADVVRMALRAMPDREITVITWRAGETCAAAAWVSISGTRARLLDVHVVLTWPFGVDHIVLNGVTRDRRALEEIVEP